MSGRDAFNTLAPEIAIKVNGADLPTPAASDLIAAEVLDDVDAPGMFTLTFAAWDTAQMKPKWIDDSLFAVGGTVEVGVGYRDQVATLMKGEITGLEPDFPQDGPPTVTVRGHDLRHRLMRARRTRSYTQCKDSDIASRIASDCGLNPTVSDSGPTLPYVLQHNQTDLEFLAERARRIHFELQVQGTDLLFRPRQTEGSADLTLHREIELLSWRARLSSLGQVSSYEVRGWDPAQKKEIVGRAGLGDESRQMDGKSTGPAASDQAFHAAPSARVNAPVQGQDEADAMARHGFAEMALRYITSEAECIGDPRLRAGMLVRIEGVGERFGGLYYIVSVEHRFGAPRGFRSFFTARRNAS